MYSWSYPNCLANWFGKYEANSQILPLRYTKCEWWIPCSHSKILTGNEPISQKIPQYQLHPYWKRTKRIYRWCTNLQPSLLLLCVVFPTPSFKLTENGKTLLVSIGLASYQPFAVHCKPCYQIGIQHLNLSALLFPPIKYWQKAFNPPWIIQIMAASKIKDRLLASKMAGVKILQSQTLHRRGWSYTSLYKAK